jgi:uncharacterized protein YndB with AHSA1/START domain
LNPDSYGELEQVGDRWQLRFTRRLRHSPVKVWRALTESRHLAAWFPTDIQGERAAGARLRFVFRTNEGPSIDGQMLVFDPPTTLEFRWGSDETLRFEFLPDGEGCLLTFVNTFSERGKAARDAAGWHTCLDFLACHLDEQPAPFTSQERWQAVHPTYAERFGPAAATIGPPAAQ